jgi:hypothetical protein
MGEEKRLQHWNRGLGFRCLTTWEEAHGPPPFNYGLSIYETLKTIQVKGKKKASMGKLCPTVTGTH